MGDGPVDFLADWISLDSVTSHGHAYIRQQDGIGGHCYWLADEQTAMYRCVYVDDGRP